MLPHKRQSDHHPQTKVGTRGFCGNSRTLGCNWETLVKPEIKDSTLRRQVHADLLNDDLTALHTAPLPKEAGGAMPTPAHRSWHNLVTQLQPCSEYGGSPARPGTHGKMLRNLAGATPVLTSGSTPPITDPAVVQEAAHDVVSALPDCGPRRSSVH